MMCTFGRISPFQQKTNVRLVEVNVLNEKYFYRLQVYPQKNSYLCNLNIAKLGCTSEEKQASLSLILHSVCTDFAI